MSQRIIEAVSAQDEVRELTRVQEQTNKILRTSTKHTIELIEAQKDTNRLLVHLINNMAGGGVPKELQPGSMRLEELGEEDRYKTLLFRKSNVSINLGKTYLILEEEFGGALREFYIKAASGDADNKDFSVRITLDGELTYNGTWDDFSAENGYATDVTAFDDGTYYYIGFNNLFFNERIRLEVVNVGADITFTTTFVKIFQRIIR